MHFSLYLGSSFWSAPILMIVIGAVAFVIAFVGCCGAVKESSCMVLTFSVFLVIIFLCEIGIGIAGYIKHGQLDEILEKGFNKTMEEYNHNEEAWKLVQSEVFINISNLTSLFIIMTLILSRFLYLFIFSWNVVEQMVLKIGNKYFTMKLCRWLVADKLRSDRNIVICPMHTLKDACQSCRNS